MQPEMVGDCPEFATEQVRAARRRYVRRLAASMALYLVTLFAAETLVKTGQTSGLFLWALALLPGLAIAAAVGALGFYIAAERDEFIRMLTIHQALIATGLTLGVAAVWGFLETYGLVPHIAAYWLVFLWFLGFAIGAVVTRVTHGSWGTIW
ncbi:hypothetical protein [Pacificimonas aurantium]|nr:hypothetical protein [Pacificimonas aurantium]MBZ6377506.1 hypothetical protein [Pacificimonas aurantium]